MQKWEENQRLKNYNRVIQNAKSTSQQQQLMKQNTSKTPQSQTQAQNMNSDSQSSNRSLFSDNNNNNNSHEVEDLTQLPIYQLLKRHNLQQYAKELNKRGYGQDMIKFKNLSIKQEEQLINDLKCLPGHRIRMEKLIKYIRETMNTIYDSQLSNKNSNKQRNSHPKINLEAKKNTSNIKKILSPYQKQLQQSLSKPASTQIVQQQQQVQQKLKKPQFSTQVVNPTSILVQKQTTTQSTNSSQSSSQNNQSTRQQSISKSHSNFYQKSNQSRDSVQLQKIEEIGVDFFQQSQEDSDEFQQALQNIYKRYSNPKTSVVENLKQQIQEKNQLMSSYYSNPLLSKISTEKDSKNLKNQISQAINKSSQQKVTTVKQSKLRIQDDINVIPHYDQDNNKTVLIQKNNKILANIHSKLVENKTSDTLNIQLDYEQLKVTNHFYCH